MPRIISAVDAALHRPFEYARSIGGGLVTIYFKGEQPPRLPDVEPVDGASAKGFQIAAQKLGHFDALQTIIPTLSKEAQIYWDTTDTVFRTDEGWTLAAAVLKISAEQTDALFDLAIQIDPVRA
jgi:hypothetical protein